MSSLDAKDQIVAALLRYTRGIDRLDGDLVGSAFHPGALCVDYGAEPLAIEDFVTYAIPRLGAGYSATQHRISNISIEFPDDADDRALCEAYVLAFHVQQPDADAPKHDGFVKLHTFNGRYIDRFEERDGEWKIAQRTLRVDWSRVETIEQSMGGSWIASARDRTDVIYSSE